MDVAAWNTLLDAVYGPTRAAGTPDAFDVALLATADIASELSTTTEVDEVDVANGYGRATLDNDDWAAAAEAVKASGVVSFGTPTQAWETARFVALVDPVDDTVWNIRPLTEPLTVTDAGSAVTVRVSIAAGGLFDG